jgi:hypothetical protein
MKVVIQVGAKDGAKAWGLLVRQSAGTALPNRTFIVCEEAVRELRKAGVRFTEITRDVETSLTAGVMAGERI